MMLLDIGVTPIYRINRQGYLDDDGHRKGYSARDYVRQAAIDTPDRRVLISLVNEPGQNDLDVLNAFILEGVNEANALGRKLVAINWSYGNPESAAWDRLAPCAKALAAGGHYVGFHEGVDAAHPTLASCYPYLIGRFIEAQKRFGFKVLITEWAASKDAHNGWQTWMSADQYASVTEDAVKQVYIPNGVNGVCPFSLFVWNHGFDYYQSDDLKNAFKGINVRNPVKEGQVTQPGWATHDWGKRVDNATARATANVNIRPEPNENSKPVLGVLKDGDAVTYWDRPYSGGAYLWFKVLYMGIERYVAQVAGLHFETPAVTPPAEKRYSFTEAQLTELRALTARMNAILDSAEAVAVAPPTFPAAA